MMKRPRLECPYCKVILSYSSYRRHIETKLWWNQILHALKQTKNKTKLQNLAQNHLKKP